MTRPPLCPGHHIPRPQRWLWTHDGAATKDRQDAGQVLGEPPDPTTTAATTSITLISGFLPGAGLPGA